ncbi:hypothetical protein GCM10010840_13100 [Deinococcus aerolatus]|uniref:Uncharacterized protein n=1 Tax=Deinococcus aerolatus TaxID=522487 RepID=A0ABQ2G624_9DEIO|nr:hypothetical protein GCM10010840_13100 [Deinococcus aerolatus]
MRACVAREAGTAHGRVVFIVAGPLFGLVETGTFLSAPATAQATVSAFVRGLRQKHPGRASRCPARICGG